MTHASYRGRLRAQSGLVRTRGQIVCQNQSKHFFDHGRSRRLWSKRLANMAGPMSAQPACRQSRQRPCCVQCRRSVSRVRIAATPSAVDLEVARNRFAWRSNGQCFISRPFARPTGTPLERRENYLSQSKQKLVRPRPFSTPVVKAARNRGWARVGPASMSLVT